MLYEPSGRMAALSGHEGMVLWDQRLRYSGPCLLRGTTILTQDAAFSLISGIERTRRHPLTDEQITQILRARGIRVTRRTVAKYREDMKIPSTHQRRVKS